MVSSSLEHSFSRYKGWTRHMVFFPLDKMDLKESSPEDVTIFSDIEMEDLSSLVDSIFQHDIKDYYTKLRLERLNDLLDHTKYLLDLFKIYTSHESKKRQATLAFVNGGFYLFLIIPYCVQFQTKNKLFTRYKSLKIDYEGQTSMKNFLDTVKEKSVSILEQDLSGINRRILKKRAYTEPNIRTVSSRDRSSTSVLSRKPTLSRVPSIPERTLLTLERSSTLMTESQSFVIAKTEEIRKHTVPAIDASDSVPKMLSLAGLRNRGNTCYINSMIQCLFATRVFRDLFISEEYKDFIKKDAETNISESFARLLLTMYENGGTSVIPKNFLHQFSLLRPDLHIPKDQQDTQEFLVILLDILHDELVYTDDLINNDYVSDDTNLGKEYMPWLQNNLKANGKSPIDLIFQGQIENCLQCQRCGNTSYNYSMFYMLSLAIPKTSKENNKNKVRLEDCINFFTSDEILTGENAWNCPKCCSATIETYDEADSLTIVEKRVKNKSINPLNFFKLHKVLSPSNGNHHQHHHQSNSKNKNQYKNEKLVTLKQLNFIKLPPILVIHLSRFYYNSTKKNNAVITYPLILNIIMKNNIDVFKYKLYGLINHQGGLTKGHYTSIVNKDLNHSIDLNEQKWYNFDDEVIKNLNENNTINNEESFNTEKDEFGSSKVYVLFYERIE